MCGCMQLLLLASMLNSNADMGWGSRWRQGLQDRVLAGRGLRLVVCAVSEPGRHLLLVMSCCHFCNATQSQCMIVTQQLVLLALLLQHTTLGACYYRLGAICRLCSMGNCCRTLSGLLIRLVIHMAVHALRSRVQPFFVPVHACIAKLGVVCSAG